MKTGPDALGTIENEYGRAKYENGTQLPRNRRKRVRERKTRKRDPTPSAPPKMSPGALCDPFSRAPHRLWAMRCGRRTRRSLPSVHLFNVS
jgi:hypothetical protein